MCCFILFIPYCYIYNYVHLFPFSYTLFTCVFTIIFNSLRYIYKSWPIKLIGILYLKIKFRQFSANTEDSVYFIMQIPYCAIDGLK